jgi:hypothetical protein
MVQWSLDDLIVPLQISLTGIRRTNQAKEEGGGVRRVEEELEVSSDKLKDIRGSIDICSFGKKSTGVDL